MDYLVRASLDLEDDEGRRKFPYKDQYGNITIGVGRNLTARGLSNIEIDILKANDIKEANLHASSLSWFQGLSDNRKAVIICMIFQLGIKGMLEFKNMIIAIQNQKWQVASSCMLNSLWARQTPARAARLAKIMENG